MNVCNNCGSASRAKEGFCAGCGAAWPLETFSSSKDGLASAQASPYAKLPPQMNAIGMLEVRPKLVWLAVLLALVLGPFGLFYSTIPGAITMIIVSIGLQFWWGDASILLVLPICALWAWRATREYSYAFD